MLVFKRGNKLSKRGEVWASIVKNIDTLLNGLNFWLKDKNFGIKLHKDLLYTLFLHFNLLQVLYLFFYIVHPIQILLRHNLVPCYFSLHNSLYYQILFVIICRIEPGTQNVLYFLRSKRKRN